MIETKEQYEDNAKSSLREKHEQLFGPPTHEDSDAPAYIPWLEETIEALRRFVRASDAVEIGTLDFKVHLEDVNELRESRAALPDWITE